MDAATLITAGWVLAGMVDSGFSYAYFQREYPRVADDMRREATAFCLAMIVFGPIGLFWSIVMGWTKHGWLVPGAKP